MFGALRGSNGRRHEVDFGDGPVVIDVSAGLATVQITMTEAGASDLSRNRYVTVAVPQAALAAAMAKAVASKKEGAERGPRLVERL
jgi:thiazole synthase ThiGH ThiG subunit